MGRKKKEDISTEEKKERKRQEDYPNLLTTDEINSRLTPEQMREKMSMMGKASAEKRRKNRMMMDIARKILEMPVGDSYENIKGAMRRVGITEEQMNYGSAIIASQVVRALGGDARAAKFVLDSAGMDSVTVLKEEQFEYMKENGQNINVNLDGEISTKTRVQIYLPERDEEPE